MSYLDKTALRVVGTRPIRPDGVDKVTGRANFGADMTMPGMLWGRIKRSPHAHDRLDQYRESASTAWSEGGHHPRPVRTGRVSASRRGVHAGHTACSGCRLSPRYVWPVSMPRVIG